MADNNATAKNSRHIWMNLPAPRAAETLGTHPRFPKGSSLLAPPKPHYFSTAGTEADTIHGGRARQEALDPKIKAHIVGGPARRPASSCSSPKVRPSADFACDRQLVLACSVRSLRQHCLDVRRGHGRSVRIHDGVIAGDADPAWPVASGRAWPKSQP